MNLQKMIEDENKKGYTGAYASAKVCQDIVLSAIAKSPLSTRFKDVFDLYYLKNYVTEDKLNIALNSYIYADEKMREKNGRDIVRRLSVTFRDKAYVSMLENSDKRWIDEDIDTVIRGLLDFAKRLA